VINNHKEEIIKMEEYLRKLKSELGWMIKWLEEKIIEVEGEIKRRSLKHELK
jgi:hypothetical protein